MMRLKGLWLWPLWLFELLSGGKSFKDNPIIGSYWLNRLGLHVLRYVLAHLLASIRRLWLARQVPAPLRAQFRRDGYLLVPDFLPAEQFARLQTECRRGNQQCRQLSQADTLTQRYLLDDETLQDRPVSAALLQSARLQQLLSYTAASLLPTLCYAQVIRNGVQQGGADPQKTLHSDTFHPTMKGWLFLQDVVTADGPFTYVPGSHRLSWRRLCWEYRKSLTVRQQRDGLSEKGSLRVQQAELAALGLPAPVALTVRANTLVLADTHGFHARGAAEPGRSRREIWFYNRTNPFNPLPLFGAGWIRQLQHRVLHQLWQRRDRKEQQGQGAAVWRRISDETFAADSAGRPAASQNNGTP